MQDVHGKMVKEGEVIAVVFNSYFQDLFTSFEPSLEDIERCLPNVQAKVTNFMNEELQKPYTNEKVYETLQQMSSLNSLRPNGFSACFTKFIGM